MDIAVVVRWGGVIPGKERAAVDVFGEVTTLYEEKLADGTFTYYEPFIFRTGDFQEQLGFFLVKGPEEKVISYFDSLASRTLQAKVEQIVNHLQIEYLYTGDQILEQVQILGSLAEERVPALV